MKTPQKRMIVLTLLAAISITTLSACGQKGPLRLPSPAPPTPTTLTHH